MQWDLKGQTKNSSLFALKPLIKQSNGINEVKMQFSCYETTISPKIKPPKFDSIQMVPSLGLIVETLNQLHMYNLKLTNIIYLLQIQQFIENQPQFKSSYLIWARLVSMTLLRQVQQPRITKGCQISPFSSNHQGQVTPIRQPTL